MRQCQRPAIVVVLVAALFLAPIAGAAMVPDPTWVGGLYDGGDGDELSILVWDLTAGVVPAAIEPPAPAGALYLEVVEPAGLFSAPLPRPASRAPPSI